ncbi:MAG: branched-chain amino acid ABC transporter permease [Verrucomicrobia bacterium]|nr:branched-chain amino acid ABC transporter permease [Verrucomicrobiota bacterium]MCH8510942.1 branched-chain amino acid ABC transporter permease [Kiritimatiellia bacterium]
MQVFLNGTISGLTIALLALAFMLVYLPCRVFYLALAGIYALVPYIALAGLRHGWPVWLLMSVAVGIGIIVSILCELLNHAPLEKKHASPGAHLIASLGVYLVLVQIVALVWGNETQVLRAGIDTVYRIGETIRLTRAQVMAGCGSLILIAAFYLWLQFSNLGLRLRAMADNPVQLALHGYNIGRLRLLAFAMSGFLASASALAVANDVGFDPHGGLPFLLMAIVAVVIGGNKSFLAPILGGLVLGIMRAAAVWHWSARWQDAVSFLLLALFLLFRPHGILGQKLRLEAV